jgi:DNA-directed RNA polymerase specialized sigma subunit
MSVQSNKDEQFKKDCRVVRLKYEYPGYTGETPWLVVSELTIEEIYTRYEKEIKLYSPFVYMSRETFVPIVKSHSNDRKHQYNSVRRLDAYAYEDDIFERFHPDVVYEPFEEADWEYLYREIDALPTVVKRRIYMRFFQDMKLIEIAVQDGVSKQAVSKSIDRAIELMRKKLRQTEYNRFS